MHEIFYDMLGFNTHIFIFINQYTNIGIFPNVLHAVSSIFFVANFATVYSALCIYFYYKTNKSINKLIYFTPIYYEMVRVGICYTIFGLSFLALKFSVNLPRPFCSLDPTQFVTIINTNTERCLSSFPSAHTGLSILVAYCFWPYLNTMLKILAIIVILAVATSRITLAMHYPVDIIYSAIITILIIIIGNLIYKKLKNPIIKPIGNFIVKL